LARPVVSDLAELLYEAMGFHRDDDASVGAVVPSRSNKSTNPSCEIDTSGYTTASSFWINDTAVLTRDTTLPAVAGKAMGKVVAPGTKTFEGVTSTLGGIVLVKGEPVTVSVSVRGAVGGEQVKLGVGDSVNGNASGGYVTLTTAPQRIAVTLVPGASGASRWGLIGPNAKAVQTFYFDAIQIEDGGEATPYFDGDSDGSVWTGTPGASASTFLGSDTTWPLLKHCAAWMAPAEPIHEIVRERNDSPSWGILFDADECPATELPYTVQYVGVVITPEMSEEQIRNELKEPTGWARGRTRSIKIAGQRALTGTKRVIVRPRTPEAGMHYIRTLASETPDEERERKVLRAAVPAWEVLDYEAISGVSWADIAASFKDWSVVKTAFTDWADLADTLPSELPEP